MAPRLIPASPEFRSQAERKLWAALKSQLPPEAFLAANVHLGSHEDFYEADLVVGMPDLGFVVVEVKGGQVGHTDEGWIQYTRDGPKPIDPAVQADRGKRLLDSYVRGRGWSHGPIRFEHMVAFPDVDFDDSPPSADLPRWQLIAAGDVADAARRIWDALAHRITDKPIPNASWVAELADLLGGRPDPARALLGAEQDREEHVLRLTEEQYKVLDYSASNDRISVVGGPGTGKTWLALEQARRWAKKKERVLLVCYSQGLSRWLRQAIDASGPSIAGRVDVMTFSSYLVNLGVEVPSGADQQWWDVTLPALATPLVTAAYDALVVDESQDFADHWWPLLLSSLRGPHVLIAGDERQSVFPDRRARPQIELVPLTLSENLRNTSQIVALLNPLVPDKMRHRGGDGPPVRFVQCETSSVFDRADTEVESLLFAGHEPGSIALLTTQHRHPDQIRAEDHFGGKAGYWDGFGLGDDVFQATVMGFKGLERPVVVLAVDGFREGVARDVLYTGLSRARDQLVVVGDLEVIRAAAGNEICKRLTAG